MNKFAHPVGTVFEDAEPKLTIRIIGRCNFRCPACSTFSGPRRKGLLSYLEFQRIIDLLVENRYHGVLNISGGETTLHPELQEMISLASRRLRKSRIVVFTNGDWVGKKGWRRRLKALLRRPNVLLRFSIDRQHAVGKARVLTGFSREDDVKKIEQERLAKARRFLAACLEEKAKPGLNFDFAFKGAVFRAQSYLDSLGHVPIYPIQFQKEPASRPKKMGFMAVDLDENSRAWVYLTLGHISRGEALGGIDTLPLALEMNRDALKAST